MIFRGKWSICVLILLSGYFSKADDTTNVNKINQLLKQYNPALNDTTTFSLISKIIPLYLEKDLYNDSLMLWCERSMKLAVLINDKHAVADAWYHKGRSYIKKQEHTHAFDSFFKALEIYLDLNDKKGIASTYMQMGVVSYVQKNYHEAIRNFDDAIEVLKESDVKKSATLHYLKGLAMSESGDPSGGYEELKIAYIYKQTAGDSAGISECRMAMAEALTSLHRFSEATIYLEQSLNYFTLTKNPEGLVWIYSAMGRMELTQGHHMIAEDCLMKADSIASTLGNLFLRVKVGKQFAELYEQTLDYPKAFHSLKKYYLLKDSLFDSKNAQTISNLRSQVEMEKQLAQINLLEQKSKTEHIFNIALIIISSLLVVLAIGWYKRSKFRHEVNLKLTAANNDLQATLKSLKEAEEQIVQSEKMASLGRLSSGIAHELRNPLNFIQNFTQLSKESLSELQSAEEKDKEVIGQELSFSLDKVHHHALKAGDIINSMLKHSIQLSGETELINVNAMIRNCIAAFQPDLSTEDGKKIELSAELTEHLPGIKINAKSLHLVINNLIENAVYAVKHTAESEKNNYHPYINIKSILNGTKIIVSVKDNGGGIAPANESRIFEHFFTTKPAGKGAGLGLSIIYDILKSNNAEITLKNLPGESAEFIIVFST